LSSLNNEKECAQGIHDLLKGGEFCVVIDMNDRFPVFRAAPQFLDQEKGFEYLPSQRICAPVCVYRIEIRGRALDLDSSLREDT